MWQDPDNTAAPQSDEITDFNDAAHNVNSPEDEVQDEENLNAENENN